MAQATIERMEKKLNAIEKNVARLTYLLEDDWEVSPRVLKQLEKARKAPRSHYISHEELKKRIFG